MRVNPFGRGAYIDRFNGADKIADRTIRRAAEVEHRALSEIRGAQRSADLCRIRWAVMAAMRSQGCSQPAIARALGDRDPSTVHHGLNRADALRAHDPAFASLCDRLASA